MMRSTDVVQFYSAMDTLGISIWIDGGWAVDALLGEQTRHHDDLDIVLQQKDLQKARSYLKKLGYKNVERDDTNSWNFVLGDDKGHEIDFHVIVFDDRGNGIYGPTVKGSMYPAGSLSGIGQIDGLEVLCISLDYLIKFHTGYKPREKDIKDVVTLCRKFNLECPAELYTKRSRPE